MTIKYSFGIIFFAILLGIYSCVPPDKKALTEGLDYKDPTFRKIMDFQDQRLTDSLVNYLDNTNPLYRFASVRALASVGDSSLAKKVAIRLNDEDFLVRSQAAFTLGVLGDYSTQDSLVNAFTKFDSINPDNQFNENILEALGKRGNSKYVKLIATTNTYRPSHKHLIIGQVKALFRYMYRHIFVPEGTDRMAGIITSNNFQIEARQYASLYFSMTEPTEINRYKFQLTQLLKTDKDRFIRDNLISALSKTGDPDVLAVFRELLQNATEDGDIKAKILSSLNTYPYAAIKDLELQFVTFPDPFISHAAAEFLYQYGNPKEFNDYKLIADQITDWQTKTKLYQAVSKFMPSYYGNTLVAFTEQLKSAYNQSTNPFEKAEYIRVLGQNINSMTVMSELAFASNDTIIKTAAIESVGTVLNSDNIYSLSKSYRSYYRNIIIPIITKAIKSGDYGLVSSAADALYNSKLTFKKEYFEPGLFNNAFAGLKLPRDYEANAGLKKLISKFDNSPYVEDKIKYNNPIDWKKFDELPDTLKVKIKTNKGNITCLLFKKVAPNTVTTFAKQIKYGYYNNKYFHRVVSDFVIQSGCNRGDGYGCGDFTLRTEVNNLSYDHKGILGMASAGKDTESLQYFITLSPTPRLDTRYTSFGKVSEGLDILDKIVKGDKVIEMIII